MNTSSAAPTAPLQLFDVQYFLACVDGGSAVPAIYSYHSHSSNGKLGAPNWGYAPGGHAAALFVPTETPAANAVGVVSGSGSASSLWTWNVSFVSGSGGGSGESANKS